MDEVLSHIVSRIRTNLMKFVVVFCLAIAGAFVHFRFQAISYYSTFDTTLGELEYEIFQDHANFSDITREIYDLEETRLQEISADLENFTISFTQRTNFTLRFQINSVLEDMTRFKSAQDNILQLLNSNVNIRNSFGPANNSAKSRLDYIDRELVRLDSMFLSGGDDPNRSSIPGKKYELYSIKLSLQDQLDANGNFRLLKPVVELSTTAKPIWMFIIFYIILGSFAFYLLTIRGRKA